MSQFDLEAALQRAKNSVQAPPPPTIPQPTGDPDRDYASEQFARMLQAIDQRAVMWSDYAIRVVQTVLQEYEQAQTAQREQQQEGAVSMHVDDVVIEVRRRPRK